MDLYTVLFAVVQTGLTVYGYLLIATALVSWLPDIADTKVGQWLDRLTGPYLRLFKFIPPLQFGGVGLDVSFIVAVIVYFFVEQGVLTILDAVVRSLA
ncbi:YggT family protein [Alicyclobacillus cellulosilyticus]|nr:YggT family protein [Alicyclobacillus cellulosilyticus]